MLKSGSVKYITLVSLLTVANISHAAPPPERLSEHHDKMACSAKVTTHSFPEIYIELHRQAISGLVYPDEQDIVTNNSLKVLDEMKVHRNSNESSASEAIQLQ